MRIRSFRYIPHPEQADLLCPTMSRWALGATAAGLLFKCRSCSQMHTLTWEEIAQIQADRCGDGTGLHLQSADAVGM